uniref:Uncharacterized protein n=1 Tax=Macrostomum lignano TaxID=282301 RepID=A0A1I8FZY5_9PLAT
MTFNINDKITCINCSPLQTRTPRSQMTRDLWPIRLARERRVRDAEMYLYFCAVASVLYGLSLDTLTGRDLLKRNIHANCTLLLLHELCSECHNLSNS